MISVRKRGTAWHFRYTDADGITREPNGCSDERATERLASEAEANAAKVRNGMVSVKDQWIATAGRRPLADHLLDWKRDLPAKGMASCTPTSATTA